MCWFFAFPLGSVWSLGLARKRLNMGIYATYKILQTHPSKAQHQWQVSGMVCCGLFQSRERWGLQDIRAAPAHLN